MGTTSTSIPSCYQCTTVKILSTAFLDKFTMTYFVTKAMLINSVSLLKTIRACSTGHTRFVHVNAFGGRQTDTHMPWTKAISRNQMYTSLWPAH